VNTRRHRFYAGSDDKPVIYHGHYQEMGNLSSCGGTWCALVW
jgi:hypothetical protein